jgi:thiazole tautomerase (transcriptional regulator TenI)
MKRELHAISNGKLSFRQIAEIASQIHSFVDFIHIREKHRNTKELYEGIKLLLGSGVPSSKLIINDRIDIALLTGIHRVQLGYQSVDVKVVKETFPHLHVGCSVHSLEEAKRAEQKGADSIVYGHIFKTDSKKGMAPRGLQQLDKIVRSISVPVTAIGGITPENVQDVLRSGVKGIAVMSGIFGACNPLQTTVEYRDQLRKCGKGHEQTL